MTTAKAGKTRSRILEAARELFNAQGERQVSTNHIAAALGMSPGNLYYHFRNKGEIVRALVNEYSRAGMQALSFVPEHAFTIEDKRVLLEGSVHLMWHYRFVHKDIDYLLAEDEELKNALMNLSQSLIQQMKRLIRLMVKAGIYRKMNERELEALVFNSWIVLVSWIGSVGAMVISRHEDEFSKETIRRGIYQILMLDKTYVTDRYQETFQQLLDEYYVKV
ncbi:TetR/AcrR family transcriptional regulator [Sansalvadorimonas verongulae]|uniref:TetR/AcrR family transcriptional regulator n=1 Tax=Sansalvadorimonas verongulae TaxID=2172824 RepID=UPI0012BC8BB7|nr:TetR/AcrR family transcriptional regulator [Sansalvadorimonas verongulae]MTI13407.1 TetR/AcrR family transcriptional regulator [Sansalvadorimonas verongulae]